jgi:hypothetical protein
MDLGRGGGVARAETLGLILHCILPKKLVQVIPSMDLKQQRGKAAGIARNGPVTLRE